MSFGFHRPLCTSVNHLHMHMLVGNKSLKGKFKYGSFISFVSIDSLINKMYKRRLLRGIV
jgi:hypothetical protein